MIGFPFDSHVTYDADGNPVYDRAITSEPYRKLLRELFKTGIMPTESTNMQVVAGDDMNVIVKAGFAMVEGCMKLEESDRTLAVQAADANYDRIDTVVLRLDDNDDARICDFYVLEGTPSASPVRPELTQNITVYEIGLADIFVPANTTVIADYRITDTRYEDERCGVISSISEFDTDTIYAQVQADMQEFKDVEQAEFYAWVEELKTKLDEADVAVLQGEIDEINTAIGDTDISEIGDGTLTGATSALNDSLANITESVSNLIYYQDVVLTPSASSASALGYIASGNYAVNGYSMISAHPLGGASVQAYCTLRANGDLQVFTSSSSAITIRIVYVAN